MNQVLKGLNSIDSRSPPTILMPVGRKESVPAIVCRRTLSVSRFTQVLGLTSYS